MNDTPTPQSDTPRTDIEQSRFRDPEGVDADFARILERELERELELDEARAEVDTLKSEWRKTITDCDLAQANVLALRRAMETMSKRRAAIIFVDTPEQVADFFKPCDAVLSTPNHGAPLLAELKLLKAQMMALELDLRDYKGRFCAHHATPGGVKPGCPECGRERDAIRKVQEGK